jgi:hypothetical protein
MVEWCFDRLKQRAWYRDALRQNCPALPRRPVFGSQSAMGDHGGGVILRFRICPTRTVAGEVQLKAVMFSVRNSCRVRGRLPVSVSTLSDNHSASPSAMRPNT